VDYNNVKPLNIHGIIACQINGIECLELNCIPISFILFAVIQKVMIGIFTIILS